MKIQAIFESGNKRVVLKPETDEEKKLLAAVTQGPLDCVVDTKYEGHISHQMVEIVSITLVPVVEQPAKG
jgi:hypothetical protein